MRRAALVVLATVLASGCSGASRPARPARPGSPAPAPVALTSTARPLAGGWCNPSQLRASNGGAVSPMTGEHSVLVNIQNVSAAACRLPAYPAAIALRDRARTLPFRYRHGGLYIQAKPSRSIALAPRAFAHVEVAKYRCDAGTLRPVTSLRLFVSRHGRALTIALPQPSGTAELDYCRAASGPNGSDPGNTVEVGPFEAGPAQGVS